jgi:hypothetical protein
MMFTYDSTLAPKKDNSVVKRTVKYLSVCRNPKVLREILRTAPDGVIKAISNIALNALKGDVNLNASQKRLFRRHKATILGLCSKKKSLKQKRKLLQQRGGAFFLLPLIKGVL